MPKADEGLPLRRGASPKGSVRPTSGLSDAPRFDSSSSPRFKCTIAEKTSVADASPPACAELKPNSFWMEDSAKEYNMTSIASSIQPAPAATRVRRAAGSASRSQ